MASVTAFSFDLVMNATDLCAVRHKVECRAGVVGAQFELGQIPRPVNAYRVSGAPVKAGRRFRPEDVLVDTVADRAYSAARVRTRLSPCSAHGACCRASGVGGVLRSIVWKDRGHIAEAYDATGVHASGLHGQAFR